MTIRTGYLFQAENEEDTKRLASELAVLFEAGTFLALDGDLGAGKTTFSQAVARCIGVKEMVNSPTFTIIKEYKGSRYTFYHMDVYRLSFGEAGDLGLDEYFYSEGITIVEWASRIEDILPEQRLSIYIESIDERQRCFNLVPHGAMYESWCHALKEKQILQ